ncbi:hypothetical protein H4219_004263 [Mycoemilia scoparia]|uniref:MOSC domain-containing protein n=1 Tax=Mycoemilia scoparia TaxID=417184 RepID=A0A9W8DS56_9FUNG|nr:hypothetical protein H4219_004263 [Mycoemilia scoparia]
MGNAVGTNPEHNENPTTSGIITHEPPRVSALYIYPVKSCAGIKVNSARITETGFEYDRTWMVVDENLNFVSQRNAPKMALIKQSLNLAEGYLELSTTESSSQSTLRLPLKPSIIPPTQENPYGTPATRTTEDGKPVYLDVIVWERQVRGYDCGPEAAKWFSEIIGKPCRLIVKDPNTIRRIQKRLPPAEMYTTKTNDEGDGGVQLIRTVQTAFADGYPFLIATQSSIDDLNSKLPQPRGSLDFDKVDHMTFRPNIIIESPGISQNSIPPYDEEDWVKFSIRTNTKAKSNSDNNNDDNDDDGGGDSNSFRDVEFYVNNSRTRCNIPNVIRSAGVMSKNREPLRTMRSFRCTNSEYPGMVVFGINCTALTMGDLVSVGDVVKVIQKIPGRNQQLN